MPYDGRPWTPDKYLHHVYIAIEYVKCTCNSAMKIVLKYLVNEELR